MIWLNLELRAITQSKLEDNIWFFVGAYVPLTIEGKIIVDKILASCYADFTHDLAHLTITPLQSFSEIMEWIFGNELGFPVYVYTARELGKLILPNGQFWSY